MSIRTPRKYKPSLMDGFWNKNQWEGNRRKFLFFPWARMPHFRSFSTYFPFNLHILDHDWFLAVFQSISNSRRWPSNPYHKTQRSVSKNGDGWTSQSTWRGLVHIEKTREIVRGMLDALESRSKVFDFRLFDAWGDICERGSQFREILLYFPSSSKCNWTEFIITLLPKSESLEHLP